MTEERDTKIVRVAAEPTVPETVEDELSRLRERFLRYASAGTSANTKRVYHRAWLAFVEWCNQKGLASLPTHPTTVAWYAVALAHGEAGRAKPLKLSSILTELAAITRAHVEAKLPPPTRDPYLRMILRGMRREHGIAASAADPLLPAHARAIVASREPGESPLSVTRDVALILVGLASGLRRIELATLQVDQLRFRKGPTGEVCDIFLPRSKGDQEGEGHTRTLHKGQHLYTCPISALQTWLAHGHIQDGFVFRRIVHGEITDARLNERSVDAIVRYLIERARQKYPDTIPAGRYSAHSLRAGCATMLHLAGKTDLEIRDHLGHKSLSTTARYVRVAKVQGSSATKDVGL